MNIGSAMKSIRERQCFSRREMALKLGCTATSLWKIENGRVWPKNATIDRFCTVCGIPLAYLYTSAFTEEDFIISDNKSLFPDTVL